MLNLYDTPTMLVHAARRRTHLHVARSRISPEQLYLPWLCPSYHRPRREQRRGIAIDSPSLGLPPRKRRNSNDGRSTPSRRSLATAVDRPLGEIQFDALNNAATPVPPGGFGSHISLSDLRPFEYTSPLVLGGSIARVPKRFNANKQGIGGDLPEILSILRACLQVGRLERAGVILRRIAAVEAVNPEDLIHLHHEYLQAAVYQLAIKPSGAAMQSLHKWFELEIRNKGLPLNAETITYMLKASLQTLPGDRRNRLVRRYMDIGKQNDFGLEVLNQGSFSAEELYEITNICPDYNSEGPEFEDPVGSLSAIELEMRNEFEGQDQDALSVAGPIQDVRPTQQKGLGLKSLKHALSLFSRENAPDIDLKNRTMEEKRMVQAQLEEDCVTAAIHRWREENAQLTKMGLDTALQTKSFGAMMWKWQIALSEALEEELVKLAEAEEKETITGDDMKRCLYGPFLRILPVEKLAAVTILSCMTLLSSGGVDKGMVLSNCIMSIANNVEDESKLEAAKNGPREKSHSGTSKASDKQLPYAAKLKKSARFRRSNSSQGVSVSEDSATDDVLRDGGWSGAIKARVGAFLMSALIQTAKVPVVLEHPDTKKTVTQMQPALAHSHQYRLGKKTGIIVANKIVVERLKHEPVHSLLAKHLPMLVPPEPWTDFNTGGFISQSSEVVRIKLGDLDQRYYAEAAIGTGDMTQTLKGLDVLGKTAWRINQPVFDVMLQAWNSGQQIANIAPETPEFQVPPEPESTKDPLDRRRWIRAVKLIENAKSGLHSQRCFQNFQLEIARALKNQEFYFPHNVDFRGRAYPIPPYLNHMGADHCRGLLMFGRGAELGQAGLRWLKVHLANVFGYDKASLKEREAFTEENIAKIIDSASNPLGGARWWLSAEDPWQTLATCMELKNALESPDPAKFVSHLPVHQDGTCNGLQHYAALGGDSWGAQQVNLEPGDRPADIYSAVAALVKESIAADKENGNVFAQVLDGRITRKVVKQTVMTNVYGVTYIGAKDQVRKQLVAAYKDLPNDDKVNPGTLSGYIATKIFSSLSSMFRGAHDIQYWLAECANRISQSLTPEQLDQLEGGTQSAALGHPKKAKYGSQVEDPGDFKSGVIWTTPLHMPVVQPYRQTKSKSVHTNLQNITLAEPHPSNPVNKRKQLQGFPPNFIHSLDATHMLLSALKCDEQGLSFAAVHDSFWTHAANVDSMNSVLRDAFIQIHSEDVIGRLASEFDVRYKDCMYLAKVRSGSALHGKIKEFRNTSRHRGQGPIKVDELLTERKRLRLLRSSDPAEVKKGKKMVTAGSIFEEMSRDGDMLSPEPDMVNLGIGEMTTREYKFGFEREDELRAAAAEGLPVDNILAEEVAEEHQDSDVHAESGTPSNSSEEEPTAFAKRFSPKRTASHSQDTWVWLPLTFPPIPQRVSMHLYVLYVPAMLTFNQGDFDVTRLKDSKYFFS